MFLEHKIMIKNIYNKSIKIAGHKNSRKFLGFIINYILILFNLLKESEGEWRNW